jgi:hypothetical protein
MPKITYVNKLIDSIKEHNPQVTIAVKQYWIVESDLMMDAAAVSNYAAARS